MGVGYDHKHSVPPPDSSAIHWHLLKTCKKIGKSVGNGRCSPADFEGMTRFEAPTGKRPEVVRIWLLAGFRLSVGPHTIEGRVWRLRKAASLVKLLALSPGHRMHREQVMDILWPDLGRRAAANNLRQVLHVTRRIFDPDPGTAS